MKYCVAQSFWLGVRSDVGSDDLQPLPEQGALRDLRLPSAVPRETAYEPSEGLRVA